jgi:hypothetical protein
MLALSWGAGWLLFKWVRACLPSTARSLDLDLHLLADVAVAVVAVAALWSARVHHEGSLHGGVATAGYVPRSRLAWQLRYFASWALPLVVLQVGAIALVTLVEGAAMGGGSAASSGAAAPLRELATVVPRAAADALLLVTAATLATRAPARWVGDLAVAFVVAALWRGHLLYPVTSSRPVGEPLFGDIPAAALVDKGLHLHLLEWGPIATTTLVALALLSLWSCDGAPRAAIDRPAR